VRTPSPIWLIALAAACGPGIDEPWFGSIESGNDCTSDLECDRWLECIAGICTPTGSYVWQWGTPQMEYVRSMDLARDGSTYTAGGTGGAIGIDVHGGEEDLFVTRIGPDGAINWTWQVGTAASESAYALAVTPEQTVLATGYAASDLGWPGYAGNTDIWLAELDAGGSVRRAWHRGTRMNDWPTAMTLDADGNILLTGRTEGALDGETPLGGLDAFVSKLDPDGRLLWTRLVGSDQNDGGFAVRGSSDGAVYLAGETKGGLPGFENQGEEDIFVAKLTAGGDLAGAVQWGTSLFERGYALTLRDGGSLYVTGDTLGDLEGETNHGSSDIFVTRLDADLERQWTVLIGTEGWDAAADILAVEEPPRILLTGWAQGDLLGHTHAGLGDIVALALDPDDGDVLQIDMWGGELWDYGSDIRVDGRGNLYIGGGTASDLNGHVGTLDAFVLRQTGW
jgi:hypothetical protein